LIDFEEFKETLAEGGITGLSEEAMLKLREQQHKLAELIFALWLDELKKSKI